MEALSDLIPHALKTYIEGLAAPDLVIPIAFLFWLTLLAIRLEPIDGSHFLTAATYVALCTAAGVVIVVAIPEKYLKSSSLKMHFLFVLGFALLASLNWYRHLRGQELALTSRRKGKS